MAYGTLKVDTIVYTLSGADATTTVSGLVDGNFPNINITGTISGATITGNTGQFTTITAVTGIFTNTLSGAVVTAPSASAASPSFVFTGDADTGLYSPGANQVAVSTSGTQRLLITSAGRLGVGTSSVTRTALLIGSNITSDSSSTTAEGIRVQSQIQNDVTNTCRVFISVPNQASGFTTNSIYHYEAQQGTYSGTVSNQMGLYINSNLTGATNNYGVYSDIPSGTGRYNIYANGTGSNYFAGKVGIGTSAPEDLVHLSANNTGVGTNWSNARNLIRVEDTDDVQGNNQVIGGIVFEGNDTSTGAAGVQAAVTANASTGSVGGGELRLYTSATSTSLTGTEDPRVLIDSSGNVGIGTTSPSALLHVEGTSSPKILVSSTGTAASDNSILQIGIGGTTAESLIYFGDSADSNAGQIRYDHATDYLAFTANASERLRITSAGNVGIGTTSPDTKLNVVQSSTGRTWSATAGQGDLILERNGNAGLAIVAANTSYSSINFGDTDDENAGFIQYFHSDNSLAFRTGGVGEDMRIDSSGRVGIGTSSPAGFLDIAGTSGTYPTQQIRHSAIETEGEVLRIARTDTSTLRYHSITARHSGSAAVGNNSIQFKIHNPAVSTTAQNTVLHLDGSGNVGIGTTSPTETLEVAGNAILDASNATLKIKQGVTGTTGAIDFTLNSDSTSYGSLNLDYDSRSTQGLRLNTPYPLTLECGAAEEIVFKRGTTETARIDGSGNVGIGTSSPSQLLDVTNGNIVINNPVDQTPDASFIGHFRIQGNGYSAGITLDSTGMWVGTNSTVRSVILATDETERLRISGNGVITIKNGAVAEIDTLTDAATITPDLASGCNFSVSISGNRTLANPTNITAGQTGSIFITQGTGSNTLSWGSYWDFPGGTAPTLSTASGAVDRVDYIVRTTTSIQTVFTANYS